MELSDYLEIQNTIHLFFQHIDSGDSTSFATLFSENASLEIIDETMNTNKTMSGKDQMIGFCNFLHNKFKGAQHWFVFNSFYFIYFFSWNSWFVV